MKAMRPQIHYSPEKGWINDPNGLIFADGVYHIFCQHYPEDTKWGPMHWAHAVSRDLLHFEPRPIALFPTEEEYVFSGSAILDTGNVSGLGDAGREALLLFYTGHNPGTGEQTQNLAYSTDHIHFTKYEKNPLIDNRIGSEGYKRDFRDPKVFANEIRGGFTMVLAAGEAIEFFYSDNLLDWGYCGAFCPGEYGYAGICECPDLFPVETDGEKKYILSMSMILPGEGECAETHLMPYFVGDFDGDVFRNGQESDEHMLLDFGKDNYAMVSFGNTEERLLMGWGEDWNVARENDAEVFFGKLTLARKVSLEERNGRYYIRQTPVYDDSVSNDKVWRKEVTLHVQEAAVIAGLRIANQGESLLVGDQRIARVRSQESDVTAIYDNGYLELFLDGGLISYSKNL